MKIGTDGGQRSGGVAGCRVGKGVISVSHHSGYSANADLARIAAARNIKEVKSVSRYVEFKMARVKKSGASGSEIKATLRRMEKVIGKAKKKVAGLKKEEQLKLQEKCAEKADKEKLRRRRQEEYESHKRKRQAKERNDAAAAYPTESQGAKRIAEEAYRKAMEQITQSGAAAQAYGVQPCEMTGGIVDVAAGDMTTLSGAAAVDAAGAVVDMIL